MTTSWSFYIKSKSHFKLPVFEIRIYVWPHLRKYLIIGIKFNILIKFANQSFDTMSLILPVLYNDRDLLCAKIPLAE